MGDTAYGRDGEFYAAARLHLIRHGFAVTPVSLRVGRSAGLTRHRRVIQHREPLKGKANGGTPFNTADLQGEGLGGAAVGEKNTYRGWGKRPRKPPRR